MQRRSGKSTLIANALKKDKKAIVIVPTEMNKEVFSKIFKIKKERIYTFTNAIRNPSSTFVGKNIYIDEIGMCVSMLIPFHIATYTNPSMELEFMKKYKAEFKIGGK